MVIRWERGRTDIDQLLTQGRLTRVSANRELADSYLAQARTHLAAAGEIIELDGPGAFTIAYDAAAQRHAVPGRRASNRRER